MEMSSNDKSLKPWLKQLLLSKLKGESIQIPISILNELRSRGYLDTEGNPTSKARSLIKIGLVGGVFDLVHPGHIFFLEEAKKHCDILIVILARNSMVSHKPKPLMPEDFRLRVVSCLKPVDVAVLGSTQDMFQPVVKFNPDIIILGPDQHFNEEWLSSELAARGLNPSIIRINQRDNHPLAKTSQLIRMIARSIQHRS